MGGELPIKPESDNAVGPQVKGLAPLLWRHVIVGTDAANRSVNQPFLARGHCLRWLYRRCSGNSEVRDLQDSVFRYQDVFRLMSR